MTMKLYLVRHGEKISQNSGRTLNAGLSNTGIEQAKRAGLFFKDKKIDFIYCSKLERARETLEYIKPFLGDPKIIFTQEINERSIGKFRNHEEYKEALKLSGLKDYQFRPENGENYFDVEKRAQSFLESLKREHSNDTVLLIGHGIFFRLLILRMFQLHMKEMAYFNLENCSISYFEVDNGKVRDSRVNDCTHLLTLSSYNREVCAEGTDKEQD